jgi:hypothetical protein
MLDNERANEPKNEFWALVHALKTFVNKSQPNILPVSGKVLDMTSNTEFYIEL